jgi:hypothetical protein
VYPLIAANEWEYAPTGSQNDFPSDSDVARTTLPTAFAQPGGLLCVLATSWALRRTFVPIRARFVGRGGLFAGSGNVLSTRAKFRAGARPSSAFQRRRRLSSRVSPFSQRPAR